MNRIEHAEMDRLLQKLRSNCRNREDLLDMVLKQRKDWRERALPAEEAFMTPDLSWKVRARLNLGPATKLRILGMDCVPFKPVEMTVE